MEQIPLHAYESSLTLDEIIETIGPHFQDRFRRDPKFKDSLHVSINLRPLCSVNIIICSTISDLQPWGFSRIEFSDVRFYTDARNIPPLTDPVTMTLPLRLMVFFSCEHVETLEMLGSLEPPEELLAAMPNLKRLSLEGVNLLQRLLQLNPDTGGNQLLFHRLFSMIIW